MGKRIDVEPGTRFGRLTVIKEVAPRNKLRRILVVCDCGEEREVNLKDLRSSNTKSCGCLGSEHIRQIGQNNITHGGTGTRLYKTWRAIKQRCTNPRCKDYSNYGGRGITICRSWSKFENFRDWALKNGYQDNLTIDRRNNDKGYSPKNCRWATPSQQSRNQRMRAGKSGFIGVRKNGKKWQVLIRSQSKRIHLGTFTDPFSAAWVRDEFVKDIDEYATTNNLTDRRKQKKRVKIEQRGVQK